MKVRCLPEARVYASYVFPDFELGVKFMREAALKVGLCLCLINCVAFPPSGEVVLFFNVTLNLIYFNKVYNEN